MQQLISVFHTASRDNLGVYTLLIMAILVTGCTIKPADALHPDTAPDFSQIEEIQARKTAFFEYLLPQIDGRNREILQSRHELLSLFERKARLSKKQLASVEQMAAEYEIEEFDVTSDTNWQELLDRVDIVPPSLALAQAANESAWGTSRFAQQGDNYFGQWCFEPGCGIVPDERPEDASYEVAHFTSVQHSVARYMHNLNQHPAYKELRNIRTRLRSEGKKISGMAMADGLEQYSELGAKYVEMIQTIINTNDLNALDARA